MKRALVMVAGLLAVGGAQAVCYELRAPDGEVIRSGPTPPFAPGMTSLARSISEERGGYVTTREGDCPPVRRSRAASSSSSREDVKGPACQAPDGRWHPYGSAACDPVATSEWLQKDLDFLALYQSFLESCVYGIDVHGREGAQSSECITVEEARPRMRATLNKVLALPPGTLTSAQMRVLLRLQEGQEDVRRALKGARPLDIRIVE